MTRQRESEVGWSESVLRDPHGAADKARRVKATFERIAGRYDLANRIHSFGRDRAWRRAAVAAVGPRGADAVLDAACGTGVMAGMFAAAGCRKVVGADFSPAMLAVARRRFAAAHVEWVEADVLALPFDDESFDVVSIGFGLRNLSDPAAGLAELRRVLRPRGRLAVLEFAPPEGRWAAAAARWFIRRVIPLSGRLLAGERAGGYKYLAASVDAYLSFARQRQAMTEAGFAEVRTARRFAFGCVGVHVGVRS